MIFHLIKQYKGILLILLFALILRLFFLDRVPTGITNDELHFVLNAKAIAMTGHDMSGLWSPWNLTTIPTEFPTSELSFIPVALFIKFLPLSLFAARLPYVLLTLGTIFLTYVITEKMIGKYQALLTAFIFAINPWSLYLSRTAFDPTVALFFYVLAFYLLLICKKWLLLLSFPALFFAFYSYLGTKIIFIPFVLITSFYSWYFLNNKKFTKQYAVVLILSICLFLYFISSLNKTVGSRSNELFLPNSPQITQEVNSERQLSIHTPFTNIFSNKGIIYAKQLFGQYINSFSPESLFVDGDGYGAHLTFEYSGFFYYVDFILFFVGFYWLFRRKAHVGWVLVGILLISQIPSIVHVGGGRPSMVAHSILFFPFFTIFLGCGIYGTVALLENKKLKILFIVSLVGIYAIGISAFFYSYFFRFPIYNSESFNFSSRLLISYITREQSKTTSPILVIVSKNQDAEGYFRSYIFYNNLYNQSTAAHIQELTQHAAYTYNNVHFMPYDKNLIFNKNETIIVAKDISNIPHDLLRKPLAIPQLKDSGSQFIIYNGKVCNTIDHPHYIQNITFTDLNVEKLSDLEFCKKFIIQY